MIHALSRTDEDESRIDRRALAEADDFDYSQVIVKKPWGYEYLVFENRQVAIWMLHIARTRKTSLHCHPRKSAAMILLGGQGFFRHLGGGFPIDELDAVNIEAGAFHCTEARSPLPIDPVSENGIWLLEIESPPLKKDLARAQDEYGRAGKTYEGASHMVWEPKQTLKLAEPAAPESVAVFDFLNQRFIVRRGPLLDDRHRPRGEALICVVEHPDGLDSGNPYLKVGKVFPYQDFKQHTTASELEGVLTLTIERMAQMTKLSDGMAAFLADQGIDHVFAVCGGGAMHLVDSFGGREDLRYIATHHEQAAAMAAEGYARISGKPGLCLVTSGPGGTNAITGVYGAWVDSIPTIFISGQVTQDTLIKDTGLRQFGIQEGNIVELVKPITKYAVTVTDPLTIRHHLEKAYHLATSGRPGPVWLDIPLDVQSKLVAWDELPGFSPERDKNAVARHALKGAVRECIAMLSSAQRPLMIFGYGVRLAGAEGELRRLATRLGLPTISSWTASDIMPTDDPDYVGRSGIMGDRAGNFAVQNCDLVLVVGSRLSIPQVGYNYKLFARAAKKIMVDIDRVELFKPSLSLDLPIEADAGEFLREINAQLDALGQGRLAIDAWRERCAQWKGRYPVVLPEYKENTYKVNSFYFVGRLAQLLGPEAVVVTDMGTSFTCTMQTFRTKAGQRLFTSSGFASMGFGLPGAIGAALAAGRQTVLITGDGGLQMNIQELQTLVHYRLPIVMFVLNNDGYLTIKQMQQNHFGRYIGSDPGSGLSCPDILKLAAAYGIEAIRIHDQSELDQGLARALSMRGPFICEVMMPEDQQLIPRVSSLKLPDGTICSKPLEDLFPFLDREEFAANMIVDSVDILAKQAG